MTTDLRPLIPHLSRHFDDPTTRQQQRFHKASFLALPKRSHLMNDRLRMNLRKFWLRNSDFLFSRARSVASSQNGTWERLRYGSCYFYVNRETQTKVKCHRDATFRAFLYCVTHQMDETSAFKCFKDPIKLEKLPLPNVCYFPEVPHWPVSKIWPSN